MDAENDKQLKELQLIVEDTSKYDYYEKHFKAILEDVNQLDAKLGHSIDAYNSVRAELAIVEGDIDALKNAKKRDLQYIIKP